MLMLNALGVIAAYVLVASWAYRRGRAVLVICAAGFLALLMAIAGVLAVLLDAPATSRLLLYVLSLGAPIVIVPTWLLLLLRGNQYATVGPIPTAVVGAAVGFVMGYMFTIVGFPTP